MSIAESETNNNCYFRQLAHATATKPTLESLISRAKAGCLLYGEEAIRLAAYILALETERDRLKRALTLAMQHNWAVRAGCEAALAQGGEE